MAKFTVTSCTRVPREFRQGGTTQPWHYYLPGKVPAEYHVHLTGMIDVGGKNTNVLGTMYTFAGAADAGEDFFGLRLAIFPEGAPRFTVTPPKGDDTDKSAPIDAAGNPKAIIIDGKRYEVPKSAVRAVYTVKRYWLDIEPEEITVRSRDGEFMKTKDGTLMVKIVLNTDLEPRLHAPVAGFVGVPYDDVDVNHIRVMKASGLVNVIRGKVTFA